MKNFTRGTSKLGALLLVGGLLLAPVSALAQTADDGISLTVTPLTREVNVDPGETITGEVEFTNDSNSAVTLYPVVNDFEASNDPDSGAPEFKSVTNEQGLASWTNFDLDQVSLEAGQKGTFTYTIQVPDNADPGGHYGAVFGSTEAPNTGDSGSTIGIAARVGSLLLLTVSGEITTQGEIVDFRTDNNIYQSGPVNFRIAVKNNGNVHFTPMGTIDISGPTSKSIQVNDDEGRVLPSSVRNYDVSLTDDLPFGRYTANVDIMGKAPNGETVPLTATTTFWVVPFSAILVLLLVLVILYMLLKSWSHSDGKKSKK
ncbi:hypothetical protein KC644_01665 [Candidatus Berkelbacteria bacterium]|nr:hypothetical protein [Candidatus Berkelbacteria bacterium]